MLLFLLCEEGGVVVVVVLVEGWGVMRVWHAGAMAGVDGSFAGASA